MDRCVVKRRGLLGLAVAALGGWAQPTEASEHEIVRLGLAVHIARDEDGPVAEEAFLERQVATANRISFDAVLAHELGHFLGNPRHSETVGNLMSYQHTEVLPFLDPLQQRRLHQAVTSYLQTGELHRLGAERDAATPSP